MRNLTKMVKMRGMWLMLLSTHSRLYSVLRFFFITMALRKGAMSRMVSAPVRVLASQRRSHWSKMLRIRGRAKVNIRAITAAERME